MIAEPTAPPSWPMLECELLERPDQHELAQDRGEQGRLGGVPVGLGDDELDPIDMGSQRLAPSHVALSKK